MFPGSVSEARELLGSLGASWRLLVHTDLVGEAAEEMLAKLRSLGVQLDVDFVRIGIVLHDAGKILHATELTGAGNLHEEAGETLLLKHGVAPSLARVCRSHARWGTMEVSFEELMVALADTLWKGVRSYELERRVVDHVASLGTANRWDLFIDLDTLFEKIAADGPRRLERSRQPP